MTQRFAARPICVPLQQQKAAHQVWINAAESDLCQLRVICAWLRALLSCASIAWLAVHVSKVQRRLDPSGGARPSRGPEPDVLSAMGSELLEAALAMTRGRSG
jgi:hypothetical protein